MHLGLSFWGSKTLLSAIELGLFTELAKKPLEADTVRDRLKLHPRSVRDFLDALVALHMLERDADGKYRNAPETNLFLDRAKPSYAGGILEMANARLYPFWGALTDGLRTGQPQNEAKSGGDPFKAIYADKKGLEDFLSAMTGISLGRSRPPMFWSWATFCTTGIWKRRRCYCARPTKRCRQTARSSSTKR